MNIIILKYIALCSSFSFTQTVQRLGVCTGQLFCDRPKRHCDVTVIMLSSACLLSLRRCHIFVVLLIENLDWKAPKGVESWDNIKPEPAVEFIHTAPDHPRRVPWVQLWLTYRDAYCYRQLNDAHTSITGALTRRVVQVCKHRRPPAAMVQERSFDVKTTCAAKTLDVCSHPG